MEHFDIYATIASLNRVYKSLLQDLSGYVMHYDEARELLGTTRTNGYRILLATWLSPVELGELSETGRLLVSALQSTREEKARAIDSKDYEKACYLRGKERDMEEDILTSYFNQQFPYFRLKNNDDKLILCRKARINFTIPFAIFHME